MEARYGRVRNDQSGCCFPLDLDLLLYGDLVGEVLGTRLPRSDVKNFAFVLCPLAEIAGMRRHPESGERYQVLWERFDRSSQPLMQVDMLFAPFLVQRSILPAVNFQPNSAGCTNSAA